MIRANFLIIFFLILTLTQNANSSNSIVVKVGEEIVTSYEVENEIRTILFLKKQLLNQENINKTKDIAVKELMRKSIKKSEIKKYEITNYNSKDLENYLMELSKFFKVQRNSLKNYLAENNINYEMLVDKVITDLKWNSLIFSLYKNQISINAIEVENEIKLKAERQSQNREYKLSEIEFNTSNDINRKIDEIKKSIKEIGFGQTAKKFSVSPSSDNNGEIGWFSENSLNKQYKNELNKIEQGFYTSPIILSNSAVILKIDEIKITKNDNLDLEKIKTAIINEKKQEKLRLFSRSHFSKTENQILINFL